MIVRGKPSPPLNDVRGVASAECRGMPWALVAPVGDVAGDTRGSASVRRDGRRAEGEVWAIECADGELGRKDGDERVDR